MLLLLVIPLFQPKVGVFGVDESTFLVHLVKVYLKLTVIPKRAKVSIFYFVSSYRCSLLQKKCQASFRPFEVERGKTQYLKVNMHEKSIQFIKIR